MEIAPAVAAAYEAALPDDPRVERKKMFGAPCAFVNRQMFFGTFEATLIARVGPARVQALVDKPGMRMFTPMPERPWRDYVQMDAIGTNPAVVKGLAAEALAWAATLPAKAKKPKARKSKSKAE
jgi:hypothetical protein